MLRGQSVVKQHADTLLIIVGWECRGGGHEGSSGVRSSGNYFLCGAWVRGNGRERVIAKKVCRAMSHFI